MARVLRLRSEAASAVPVREVQRRTGLSRDLQQQHPAMGAGIHEDRQRHTTRLQAGKDLNSMTKLIVDGKEIEVPPQFTLLQACAPARPELPPACYHERPSTAVNSPPF